MSPRDAATRRPRRALRHKEPGGEAGRLCVDGRSLGLAWLGPALLADQRHEGDAAEIFLLEAVFAQAAYPQQRLTAMLADRNDQPAADGKLALQGFRHTRTAGRDDDGLERRLLRQALGAVGDDDLGIGIAEPLQPAPRQARQVPACRSMANTLFAMRLITEAA